MQLLNSDLLALSYDSAASPAIQFKKGSRPDGWGFAWYPRDGVGASVLKDPHADYDMAIAAAVQRWDRFRSSVFLCHSGTHRGRSFTDTHPFVRSHAGRDWIFAHNGDLGRNLAHELPLTTEDGFEPVGYTDTEHAFCWLMAQVKSVGARTLRDVGWPTIRGWFRRLNQLGTFNVVWSDGECVIAYHDQSGFNGLHSLRRTPPHVSKSLESDLIKLEPENAVDENRTFTIIATRPLSDEAWSKFTPGEMRVFNRGQLLKISDAESAKVAERSESRSERVSSWAQAGAHAPERSIVAPGQVLSLPPLSKDMRKQHTYQIIHETVYRYQTPVETSTHTVRLQPVRDLTQDVLEYKLEISPHGHAFSHEDVFGNYVLNFQINSPYHELWVRATSTVVVHRMNVHASLRSEKIPLVWMPWQRQMMDPFLLPPELPETELRELSGFAMSCAARRHYDLVETLIDLNETLHRDFTYQPGTTTLETSPFEVYTQRRGVCQDFANLFICLARLLGVPARYRVGYIHMGKSAQNKIQSEASHAWAEVYLPFVGWRGFDPTNGTLADLNHIRVASGRNFRDATPTAGTLYSGGRGEQLEVNVRVTEIDDASNLI